MEQGLQVFNFKDAEVRVVTREGEPWWVAKDVCDALELSNHRVAISSLDDDEKDGVSITDAMGRTQITTVISEPGLYTLIIRSRKPEARAFKRWITHEVIPTIRKTGMYASPQDYLSALKALVRVEERKAALVVRNKELIAQIEDIKSHTDLSEVTDKINKYNLIGEVAKLASCHLSEPIGKNIFMRWLRYYGYVMMRFPRPTQKSIREGLIVPPGTRINGYPTLYLMVTPYGSKFFIESLIDWDRSGRLDEDKIRSIRRDI